MGGKPEAGRQSADAEQVRQPAGRTLLAKLYAGTSSPAHTLPHPCTQHRHLQNEIARYKSEAAEATEALKSAKEGAAGGARESEQILKLTKVCRLQHHWTKVLMHAHWRKVC